MNIKYFKFLLIIIVLLPITLFYAYFNGNKKISNEIDTKITKLWNQSKASFNISIGMLKDSPIELYFIGSDSYNILYYAFNKKNTKLIDELLKIYMQTLPYAKNTKKYTLYYISKEKKKSSLTLKENIYIWSNKDGTEELISSAQFIFVVSFVFNEITKLPNNKRTITMNNFIKKFSPILSSHYQRWILGVTEIGQNIKIGSFNRRGWGCKDNKEEYIYSRTLNQMVEDLGQKAYHGATYCNVIADPTLLIVSGLGYYLAGTKNKYPIYTIKNEKVLENFFIKSIKIISKEFKKNKIVNKNTKDKNISILTFQDGAWFGHPDYYYSDYTGSTFPKNKDRKSNPHIGIDISHGSRIIYLLEMLLENKNKFQINFPTQNDMKMFANAFLYKVFNQDYQQPLFKNYMNGSNGWFRVNYESKQGYGYPPYSVGSTGALLGGYPRLSKYNTNLNKIFITLLKKLNSSQKDDIAFIHKFYETTIWTEGTPREIYQFYNKKLTPKSAIYLINFYSSLIYNLDK